MSRDVKKPAGAGDPFHGLRPARPPAELRSTVLGASRKALRTDERSASREARSERGSGARAWNLAWAASVLLLAGLHLRMPSSAPLRDAEAADRWAVAAAADVADREQLAVDLGAASPWLLARLRVEPRPITLSTIWRGGESAGRAETWKEEVL